MCTSSSAVFMMGTSFISRAKNAARSFLKPTAKKMSTYRISPPYPGPKRSAAEMYKLYPVTQKLEVPAHIVRPPYVDAKNSSFGIRNNHVEIKTPEQVATMRKACEIASYIREFAGKQVAPGITTDEIDKRVHAEIIRLNVYPSPLGYHGFPKSICTSVNNVVCHGIPDLRVLEEGDIINIDVSVYVDGYHGDCSGMFVAGKTDDAAMQLITATKTAMDNAIAICAPGVELCRIGEEVQKIAEKYNYGVVPSFAGHGIGHEFHMAPHILHYRNDYPGVMVPGMVFTIEPMLNETIYGACVEHDDGWTALTVDGARSAQFEQTIVITETGYDIMTKHQPGVYEMK